jgi:uncharacterized protein (DUF1015 family)
MANLKSFRGIYYNQDKVRAEDVITQPYDKIDAKLYQAYLGRSSHSMARLILKNLNGDHPSSENPGSYAPQRDLLKEWHREGIFLQDAEEAVYSYVQEFNVQGHRRKRNAFVALGQLHEYRENIVFPHEETLSKPKADRLNHLTATETQFGFIFMLYEDPQNEVQKLLSQATASQKTLFDFNDLDYSVNHRLTPVYEKAVIQELNRLMKSKRLLIADGHHRYETALAFYEEMKKKHSDPAILKRYDSAMIAFVNLYDEGLTILPTHRLVRNLSDDLMMNLSERLRKDFRIERVVLPAARRSEFIQNRMKPVHPDHHLIGLYYGADEFMLLHYMNKAVPENKFAASYSDAWRGLDVVILHKLIINEVLKIQDEAVRMESNISYCREIDEALEAVNKGRAQLALILNPTKPEQVRDVAFGSERMPQKSTDFYPKFMTGLLLNHMGDGF